MTQLRALAKEYNLKGYSRLRKDELTILIDESSKGSKNQLPKSNKMGLNRMNMAELKALAKENKLKSYSRLRKDELIKLINDAYKEEVTSYKTPKEEVPTKERPQKDKKLTKRQNKHASQKASELSKKSKNLKIDINNLKSQRDDLENRIKRASQALDSKERKFAL